MEAPRSRRSTARDSGAYNSSPGRIMRCRLPGSNLSFTLVDACSFLPVNCERPLETQNASF